MSSKLITSHFATKKTGRTSKNGDKLQDLAGPSLASCSGVDDYVGTPINKDLQLLHEFDLTLEYGPCTGITRLERWERAAKHGLNPPQKVKDLILQNLNDEEYTLW